MRKLVIRLIIEVLLSLLIGFLLYLFLKSRTLSFLISLFFVLLFVSKPSYRFLNQLFRKSDSFRWYFDFLKFLDSIPQKLDIVNLGSSSGKYAFKYEKPINGLNWALAPQTLFYDFNILRQYHSYLKPEASVILPLCPFSGCIKNFKDPEINLKYYSFLHPAMLHEYSPEIHSRFRVLMYHPLILAFKLLGLHKFIRNLSAALLKPHPCKRNNNPLDVEDLEEDAARWIDEWKKQFNISDLDSGIITDENRDAIQFNKTILTNIAAFCLERNLKLIIVIPPVTKILGSKFSNTFKDNYIYSLLSSDIMNRIKILDYFNDERFSGEEYYFNSYFLNARGSKYFTNQVLIDIDLI